MTVTRWAARAVVPVLALGSLLVTASPAHAGATPWRFTTRATARTYITAQSIASVSVSCPAGYLAIGGGVAALSNVSQFEVVAEYRVNQQSWAVIGHNYDTATMTVDLATTCADAQSVGSLDLVSADFAQVGTMAGGAVSCPAGKVAISGGADWNSSATNTRRIDTFSPTTDGHGWYANGFSPVAATLHIEAYCAPAADVGVTPMVRYTDYAVAFDRAGQHQCPPGTRVASAGIFTSAMGSASPDPYSWRGNWLSSAPSSSPTAWTSLSAVNANTRLTSVTWCLPASQPVAVITQKPPSRTNSTTGTFAYTASDPAGETLAERYCLVDESVVSDCPMNTPVSFTGLSEGTHLFRVTVVNTSAQRGDATYSWTIELTAPTATGPPAGPAVTGPLGVTFSEPVNGVTASTMQVRVAGQSATLPGTVSMNGTAAARWTPASPLVPGESYTVSLTSGITDVAGNALAPVSFTVRTALLVENTSPAVREYWDRDTSTAASGGGYLSSNNGGSSATWRVTASAGQTASLYGVRTTDGGYAEVWLDGAKKATVSFYASAVTWRARLWTSAALTAGTHTVQLRVLGTRPSGSSGSWVSPDYVQVGTALVQETSAVQAFRRVAVSAASGGSYDLVLHRTYGDTGTAPSYALTFKGTGARVYVTRFPGAGAARVYVDGVLKATVSLNSSSTLYKQTAYTVTGLSNARHTIQVYAAGTATGASSGVTLDAFTVF